MARILCQQPAHQISERVATILKGHDRSTWIQVVLLLIYKCVDYIVVHSKLISWHASSPVSFIDHVATSAEIDEAVWLQAKGRRIARAWAALELQDIDPSHRFSHKCKRLRVCACQSWKWRRIRSYGWPWIVMEYLDRRPSKVVLCKLVIVTSIVN